MLLDHRTVWQCVRMVQWQLEVPDFPFLFCASICSFQLQHGLELFLGNFKVSNVTRNPKHGNIGNLHNFPRQIFWLGEEVRSPMGKPKYIITASSLHHHVFCSSLFFSTWEALKIELLC